jgi:microcystin-dependent protein
VSTPFIGEIKMVGWNFAPVGWAQCDGRLVPISQYEALFTLIGTTYGGDGQNTFALPDLRGRIPVHPGNGFVPGQQGGSEMVVLTGPQLPVHSHSFMASAGNGTQATPAGYLPAALPNGRAYVQGTPATALAAGSIQPDGGGGNPHENMQPYLSVMFIIALDGTYPSQS